MKVTGCWSRCALQLADDSFSVSNLHLTQSLLGWSPTPNEETVFIVFICYLFILFKCTCRPCFWQALRWNFKCQIQPGFSWKTIQKSTKNPEPISWCNATHHVRHWFSECSRSEVLCLFPLDSAQYNQWSYRVQHSRWPDGPRPVWHCIGPPHSYRRWQIW